MSLAIDVEIESTDTISQVEVWVNQMRSLGELITVQVKAIIMTTSPYSPQIYFESMHSQA
jgi:hypothetical protein